MLLKLYCFRCVFRQFAGGDRRTSGDFTHVGWDRLLILAMVAVSQESECTTDDPVELIEIDGETKLRYRPSKWITRFCGTYADPRGNVSLGRSTAIDMDSYSMALAAQQSGGKVFVQVRDAGSRYH